jgi:4-hydroxybutyrate dehydrogenase
MNTRLQLPRGLAELGVVSTSFEKIIEGALADHCHKTNPRIAVASEYEDILNKSM